MLCHPMLNSKISIHCWLISSSSRMQQGRSWLDHNLWCFSFSDVFNRCKLEYLNYGLTPAQLILLECLQRTQRKRISGRGWDHWLPSLQK
jgi:hypothetical protein